MQRSASGRTAIAAATFRHQRPFHDVRHPPAGGQTALYGDRDADDAADTFTLRLTAVMLVTEIRQNR
jgi:hypothetical protein